MPANYIPSWVAEAIRFRREIGPKEKIQDRDIWVKCDLSTYSLMSSHHIGKQPEETTAYPEWRVWRLTDKPMANKKSMVNSHYSAALPLP